MSPFIRLLAVLILSLAALSSQATHLMGGYIGYQYMQDLGGGNHQYLITFVTYTNCNSQSNVPDPEDPITLAIYMEPANPNDDKPFLRRETFNNPTVTPIIPSFPSGCNVSIDACINEAVYTKLITLSDAPNGNFSNGYHIYYDRCCRNGNIINLDNPGGQGMGFYAFIPNPLLQNSTPIFDANAKPVPFICVGDTFTISNAATDAIDNDLLVFSFEDAYKGFSSSDDPDPFDEQRTDQEIASGIGGSPGVPELYPQLDWPIPSVDWQTTYNKNDPFGPTGYAYINSSNGNTKFYTEMEGNFVVAVEIKEYRNNIHIATTRRDFQFLATTCPANEEPDLVSHSTNTANEVEITIEEGDDACFDITFNDPEGDFVTVTAEGTPLMGALTSPTATINTPVSGSGSATAEFCWDTGCDQGRDQFYLVTLKAEEDGCVPRETYVPYKIYVQDFDGPPSINGPSNICEAAMGVNYSVEAFTDATYDWVIDGGTIVAGAGTNAITVDWGPDTCSPCQVHITTTSRHGCTVDPLELIVNQNPIEIDAGRDTSICGGEVVVLGGSPTAPAGFTFDWGPALGLDDPNAANPNASPSISTLYILTATDGGSCTKLDSVFVSVTPSPLTISNDTTICEGDTISLVAGGGTTYSWTNGTFLSDASSNTPLAFPDTTMTFVLTMNYPDACVATDSVVVNVVDFLVAEAGSDSTMCFGVPFQLGGPNTTTNDVTIQWDPILQLDDDQIAQPTATFTVGDYTYSLLVTDTNGCTAADTIDFSIYSMPNPVTIPDTSICGGETINLFTSDGATYSWGPTTGLNDPASAITAASPTVSTTYRVSVTSADGCSVVEIIQVDVLSFDAVAGNDLWVCPGFSINLFASGGASYNWSPAANLDDPTSATPLANPPVPTTYIVTITGGNGCIATDTVELDVNPIVPAEAGDTAHICFGDTATIGGSPTGPDGSTYLWDNAAEMDGSTTANPEAYAAASFMYHVTVTNNTCEGVDSVFVNVIPLPTINVTPTAAYCFGDSVQVVATGAASYDWEPGTGTNDSLIANPYIIAAVSDVYTVHGISVTNGVTCANQANVTVTVHPLPLAEAGPPSAICVNDSVQLAGSGGTGYLWDNASNLSDNAIANPFASPTLSTMYHLTVTDNNLCSAIDSVFITVNQLPAITITSEHTICITDTTTLTATGGDDYLWSPGLTLSATNTSITNAFPNDTTMYLVTVTDGNNCVAYDSVRVNVNQLPPVFAGNDIQICIGETAQLNATGANQFAWNTHATLSDTAISNPIATPTDTTTYIVTGIDGATCAGADTVIVIVNPLPVVDAGDDTLSCKNQPVVIGGTNTAPPLSTISWSPITHLDDANINNPTATPPASMTYVATVVDSNNCVNSDSTRVLTYGIAATQDTSTCANEGINLGVLIENGVGPFIYTWGESDGPTIGNQADVFVNPSQPTTYSVSVTDANSCFESLEINVDVRDAPEANLELLTIIPTCDGLKTSFGNGSLDGESFHWDFGNGDTLLTFDEEDGITFYLFQQTYDVVLTATNDQQCIDTANMHIDVTKFTDYVDMTVSNVFTPNHDGINEFLEMSRYQQSINECGSLTVYNRWGTPIFYSEDTGAGWNGKTFAGEDVPAGTYYYVMTIKDYKYSGSVTLYR